jgi:hypothetical protein
VLGNPSLVPNCIHQSTPSGGEVHDKKQLMTFVDLESSIEPHLGD